MILLKHAIAISFAALWCDYLRHRANVPKETGALFSLHRMLEVAHDYRDECQSYGPHMSYVTELARGLYKDLADLLKRFDKEKSA